MKILQTQIGSGISLSLDILGIIRGGITPSNAESNGRFRGDFKNSTSTQVYEYYSGDIVKYNNKYYELIKEFTGSISYYNSITPANSSDFKEIIESPNYIKLSNGLIIQWGKFLISSASIISQQFPVEFSSKPTIIINPVREKTDQSPQGDFRIRNLTTTMFDGLVVHTTQYTTDSYAHWIAIGY